MNVINENTKGINPKRDKNYVLEEWMMKTTKQEREEYTKDLIEHMMNSMKENEFQLLDEQTQQELVEISVGKLSTTILIGRLKLLSNKIKDVSIRKSIMSLGYMIYTVSLQSKSIEGIEKKIDQLIKFTEQNEQELKRIKMRSRP